MNPKRNSTLADLKRTIAGLKRELAESKAETREALEQQTATAEVLQVINSSPGELRPVFDAMLEKALTLCDASFGQMVAYDGAVFRAIAWNGYAPRSGGKGTAPMPGMALHQLVQGEQVVQIADITADEVYRSGNPVRRRLADEYGARTAIWVALRKEAALVGAFVIYRTEVRPFTDRQIALLQNFAAQAVIAMENARLITETREALEQQTATAEVLGVINASPGNLAPVFDAMLEKALRLCEATHGQVWSLRGGEMHAVAVQGDPKFSAWIHQQGPIRPFRGSAADRIVQGEDFVHLTDRREEETYRSDPVFRELVDTSGVRSSLSVPLRKDDELLGMVNVYRQEVRPFTDRQIALLQNFAAQAVIAIENARLITETREALEQQTATAEVLGVINASPGDLKPVFDEMLTKALHLCEATFGFLDTYEGERFCNVAHRGLPTAVANLLREPRFPADGSAPRRVAQGEPFVHLADLREDEGVTRGGPIRQALVEIAGARTQLTVGLRKDKALLGIFTIYRREVRPFTDKQIALLQNFAAQAVIAIENARLITETREALERQTATAEVLGVINSSPGDLAPVFDAMLEKALDLCSAAFGVLWTYDGEFTHAAAIRGATTAYREFLSAPHRPGPGSAQLRLIQGERFVHVADLADSDDYRSGDALPRALVDLGGGRSLLALPLRKDGAYVGAIMIYRQQPNPFSDREIALLENFAAQAVIAMENARLITETREALDQQTATAEVLGVINSSPGDLAPVFEAILEKAHSLCDAPRGTMFLFDGELFRAVAMRGLSGPFADRLREGVGGSVAASGPLLAGEPFVHIPDMAELNDPAARAAVQGGTRTLLSVPLRKGDALLGMIVAGRPEVRPFTDKQIALLQNFAAQAVIAMENARLITETREALEQQTATAEVLGVINASPGDLAPVFDAMLDKAMRLCEATFGALRTWDGEYFHAAASRGAPPELAEFWRTPLGRSPNSVTERLAQGESLVAVPDLLEDEMYRSGAPGLRKIVELGGARSYVTVALRKDGRLLGQITVYRREVRPFTDKQIALLQNFAAQAVIAIENARLLTETREARDDAETALRELQAAQANLVQAQKMAALGQLTAGIAHEIKNPLNFVNNFASLSVELLDELKETAAPALAALDADKRADVDDTMELLTGNLEKIAEHGKRADNIVKSMLEHSRGVSGERREVDLNGVIEEALNLAYHGARAQDQSFNITLERDYAESLKPIELAPQEMTRVFLNLIGNGFYAATKRARDNGDGSFRPVLMVRTREAAGAIEVRVRDNGIGIPPEIRDRLFQPFFTTKPTGEGTGLGLSISYDIITQQHGGTITVESEPGAYTEFTVRLPR